MSKNIIWTVEGKIKAGKKDTLMNLMKEMCDKVITEPGTINYEWTLAEDDGETSIVYERYKDADVAMAHRPTWGTFSGRFIECVDITKFVVFCNLTDELKEAVGGLNPVYMEPIGGFAK